MTTHEDRAHMIALAQAGDRDGLEWLHREATRYIQRYARGRVPKQDQSDFVADAVSRTMIGFRRYDPARGSFFAWIHREAFYCHMEARRKHYRDVVQSQRASAPIVDGQPQDELAGIGHEDQRFGFIGSLEESEALLAILHPRDAEIARAHWICDEPRASIAARLGLNAWNVNASLARSKSRLRAAVLDRLDGRSGLPQHPGQKLRAHG